MLWSVILHFLGRRYDSSVIPEGPYCYSPDVEKNAKKENWVYYVIPCPYYKTLSYRWNGCKYLGGITDDSVFNDQCKMCDENFDPSSPRGWVKKINIDIDIELP